MVEAARVLVARIGGGHVFEAVVVLLGDGAFDGAVDVSGGLCFSFSFCLELKTASAGVIRGSGNVHGVTLVA